VDRLIITATGDIPEENVKSLKNDLGYGGSDETTSRLRLFSADPPSFIEIVGSLISWKTILVASTTVFFSTLSKKFAEDIYDNRKILAEAIFSPLLNVAKAIVNVIRDTPRNNTSVEVGVSTPRGTPTLFLSFLGESKEEIAFEIACYYAVAEKINERLVEVSEKYEGRVMPARVSVSEKGEVSVGFYAGLKNDRIEFTISIRD